MACPIYRTAACVVRLPNSSFSIIHSFYIQINNTEPAILQIFFIQKIGISKYNFNHEFGNSCVLFLQEMNLVVLELELELGLTNMPQM